MYAVVRVRGTANIIPSIWKTLELLSLRKVNHCVLVAETDEMKGMLHKVKDYTTWGEVDAQTLSKLFKYRAKLSGDRNIDTEQLSRATGSDSFEAVANAVLTDKVKYPELARKLGIKNVIRLHPPLRGFEGIKRAFRVGGALGYRGRDINELLGRMLAFDESGFVPPKKARKIEQAVKTAIPERAPAKVPAKKIKAGAESAKARTAHKQKHKKEDD